jgi:uncharacterized protein YejL (UPF0352 family)
VHRAALTIDVPRVVAFVQPLTEVLRGESVPTQTLEAIIGAVVSMMELNRDMIPEVAKTHFFYVLPVTRDELLDLCIRAVVQLFDNGQQALNKYVVRVLSGLIQKRPAQMVIAFQPIVRHFSTIADIEVADLLLQMKQLLLNIDEGKFVIALVFQLLTHASGYTAQRAAHAIRFFRALLQSTVPSTVVSAYMALAHFASLKRKYSDDEFQPITSHLANGIFWPSALTLVSRLEVYPITDELVYILTKRAAESTLAIVVLFHIAANTLGGGLIQKYRANLPQAAERFPLMVLRLVITLCEVLGQRQFFEGDSEFPHLLRVLAASGDPEIVAGIGRLLSRLHMSRALAWEIGDARLLPVLVAAMGSDPAQQVVEGFLEIAIQIAKVVFIRDFLTCEPIVLGWLDQPPLAPKVVELLVELVGFPETKASLKKVGIAKKLAQLKAGNAAELTERVIAALK